jgi:Transposase DNA-binding
MWRAEASFGERNFGHAELGDVRRTRRLVELADQFVARPGGSLPEKINTPGKLKAMYRLMDCEQVTHAALLESHQRHLREELLPARQGYTLVIHDSTELEYTRRRKLDGLGQIGSGFRRGLIGHHSLLVCPETRMTLGLANQILHRRVKVPKGETAAQRRRRQSCESRLWLQGAAGLAADRRLVDVCDRGADTREFLEAEIASGRTFVIRSSQNRACHPGHADPPVDQAMSKLHDHARQLPALGTWELEVGGKTEFKSPDRKGPKKEVKRKPRTATMAVSAGPVRLVNPKQKRGPGLCVWVVRVWEIDPPPGEEPLEWFLLTNHPAGQFDEAYRVTAWYECRWVVEEYHKCLKTGMDIEGMLFHSSDRLEPAIALVSITAITLLNLRDQSRSEATQDKPATEYIDVEYVEVLSAWRHGQPRRDWTVREFVLALARLSGHQNRRGDHPPGWQKLWKGWCELQAMLTGARIAKRTKRCG